jgi:hypothetical protein
MRNHLIIDRRTVLKGIGATVALPWLEAMVPGSVLGAEPKGKPPLRMAFLYVPNGKNMRHWTPKEEGKDFTFPKTLLPLKPYKDDLLVLTGLTCDKARPHGDGPGDHARAMSAFLTGCQAKKTHGADIRVGVSVDQFAAQKVGKSTRFPTLEVGCEGGRQAGNCDSGYSCAYSSSVSWRTPTTPVAKEVHPRLVFERLFGIKGKAGDVRKAKRDYYRHSILDHVLDDAKGLKAKLGAPDRRKLEEYLSGVREIEGRLARAEKADRVEVKEIGTTCPRPPGMPRNYEQHLRLMADMLVLAFQADLTRIATFVFANEGSNRSYRDVGVPEGHHDLSHHGGKNEKLAKIQQINEFHVKQLAYLLGRLRSVKEGAGTLLDSCMLVYGSGNSDGNRHNHDDLPVLLCGKAGGAFKAGWHVRYPKETPLTNLFVTMLDRFGVRVDKFGDSTGRLAGLEA